MCTESSIVLLLTLIGHNTTWYLYRLQFHEKFIIQNTFQYVAKQLRLNRTFKQSIASIASLSVENRHVLKNQPINHKVDNYYVLTKVPHNTRET